MPPGQQVHQAQAAHPSGRRKHVDWGGRAVRIEWFIFTSLLAVILLIVIGWLIFGNSTTKSESDLVNTNKYQAVFLNGGVTSGSVAYSTYFGHITKLNGSYVVLDNVYYLTDQSSTSGSASNPQLVKLGCQQLHSPYDQMVINRTQVAFWENLQSNGKVAQAIEQYIKQNPTGPNCSQTNSSNSSTTATPQSTTPSTGTGSNSTSGH